MSRRSLFFLAAFLFLFAPSLRAADDLDARLRSLLNLPEYKHARWGLLFIDAETKQVVHAQNPDMLFAPASVTKLYSCATAMIQLGANTRYETPVYRRGDITDGRLKGDLILVATGDLTLGGRSLPDGKLAFKDNDHIYANYRSTRSELTDTDPLTGLNDLAKQVKAAGVMVLDGDVLIDERLFDRAPGSGSGPRIVAPIVVNDNLLDFTITPGKKSGEAATVEMRPRTALYQFEAKVETVAREKVSTVRIEVIEPGKLRVIGQISANMNPLVRIYPVEDPAVFARGLFIEALRRAGVEVLADLKKSSSSKLPVVVEVAKLPRIAGLQSATVSELLKVTLKVSHNPYASTLPLLVATKHGKRTLAEGMKVQRMTLDSLGVDVGAISLESGAGGGNGDRVTPRATVQLLQAMHARPDFPTFKEMLPILGVDGTLVDVVGKDSPALGKVYAKTGTYTDDDLLNERSFLRAKSLAGVMTTAKGRTLLFAVFVNDVSLPKGVETSREGKMMGKICEIVYQHAP